MHPQLGRGHPDVLQAVLQALGKGGCRGYLDFGPKDVQTLFEIGGPPLALVAVQGQNPSFVSAWNQVQSIFAGLERLSTHLDFGAKRNPSGRIGPASPNFIKRNQATPQCAAVNAGGTVIHLDISDTHGEPGTATGRRLGQSQLGSGRQDHGLGQDDQKESEKWSCEFLHGGFFSKTNPKRATFGVGPPPCIYFRGMKNELVLVDPQLRPGVALLRLNRPKELNALNLQLMGELRDALAILDKDENVRVMVLTGNEKAFAAGADIHQMSGKGAIDMLLIDQFATWEQIRRLKKPLIAAVSGFVLGGGNELVMHCDLVIASETARFGQPEILLGIMPGAGGTQRLTRQIGKVNAMEMVLTGQPISAKQALAWGLVNRVVPVEVYLDEALRLASEIALRAPLAVRLAKESVLKAQDSSLSEGLEFERKNFYMLFASADQKEGMDAFVNKRPPQFTGS